MKLYGTNNLLYHFGITKYKNEVKEILSAIPRNSQFIVFQKLLFSIIRENFEDVPTTILDADFPIIARAWCKKFGNVFVRPQTPSRIVFRIEIIFHS